MVFELDHDLPNPAPFWHLNFHFQTPLLSLTTSLIKSSLFLLLKKHFMIGKWLDFKVVGNILAITVLCSINLFQYIFTDVGAFPILVALQVLLKPDDFSFGQSSFLRL